MNRSDIDLAWAPKEARWTSWVKPFLISALPEISSPGSVPRVSRFDAALETVLDAMTRTRETHAAHAYRESAGVADTAIVVDLSGAESVDVGLALVRFGFRPIPLYNAIPSERAAVDLSPIMRRMVDGVPLLEAIPGDAPPAFLLDARRDGIASERKFPDFDNRSECSIGDFPSLPVLLENRIRRVLVIQSEPNLPALDLEAVLVSWRNRLDVWSTTLTTHRLSPVKLNRFGWRLRWWCSRLNRNFVYGPLPARSDGSFGIPIGRSRH